MGLALGLALGPLAAAPLSWQKAGALLDADFAGGRYYFAGQHYADETAWLASTFGTKVGIVRSFASHVAGDAPEILTDGGFAAGTLDGWVEPAAHAANGGVDVVGNQLVLSRNGNTANYRASRPVTLDTAKAYRLTANRVATTGSLTSCAIVAGGNSDLTAGISGGVGTNGQHEIGFAPASTSYNIGLSPSGTASQVGTITCDDFSLRECRPMAGFVQGGFSLELAATAPASAATEKVLAYLGDDHDIAGGGFAVRSHLRVVRDVSGNIRVVVTNNATEQANLNLGAVANSTAFRVRLAVTNNRFSAALDGAAIVTDTAGTLPAIARWRIGRSWSGETWDGTIGRVTLWPEALSDATLPGA